ncbi:uncharacterized protein LOC113338489 [Papaver somniferum]|uniref:uncharacterized protein LOC113338489 n=1 Tax=Papaver somniferum TaxID=3469 RepID=UPI000E70378E|nr:uncharacterized protein LOC113338489 [Papaver somniferum]
MAIPSSSPSQSVKSTLICPWSFLDLSYDTSNVVSTQDNIINPNDNIVNPNVNVSASENVKRKSYAIMVSSFKSLDFDSSKLAKPCFNGSHISIRISEDEYQLGVQDYKNCLIGKGFFYFKFSCEEDVTYVRSAGPCNIKPGIFHFRHEESSCKKKKQKETNVNEPSKDADNYKKSHSATTGDTNGVIPSSTPSVVPEITASIVEVAQSNGNEYIPASFNNIDKFVAKVGVINGTVEVTMPCNTETHLGMNVLNVSGVDTSPNNDVENSEILLSHQQEDNADDAISADTLEDENACAFEAVLTKSQKKQASEKAKKALETVNDRGAQQSNLRRLCASHINVSVVSNSMQMISCEARLGDMKYYIVGVYASTSYLTRRDLWLSLTDMIANLPGPWCIIGDFNAVLSAHEKCSGPPPTKASCDDFLAFSETNDLHHLDTRGASYTWTNSRKGRHHTELRLDKVICSEQWLLSWDSSLCITLARKIADEGYSDELHFVEVEASNKLVDSLKTQKDFWRDKSRLNWVKDGDACTKIFSTYAKIRAATNKLTHLKDDGDMYVGNTVSPSTDFISINIQSTLPQAENNFLTAMPDVVEIKDVVDDMNANGAPGPDCFSGIFFTSFWDIVGTDVMNSVQFLFQNGWLIPNANPSHQRAFLKDISIFDCIGITSEAINMLDYKTFGGNLALKFDIRKAFDTLNWEFLLQSLVGYGFCEKFVGWIHTILHSAKLSIVVNDKAMGYFGCTRGVRQGDPLSPILFCLAEDVLSCAIANAFTQGLVHHISSPRGTNAPSHVLYADDIMVFCKGTKRDVQALMNIFEEYGQNSRQFISASKCTIYSSKHIYNRFSNIVASYNITMGTLPFRYLGVPIFQGRLIILMRLWTKLRSNLRLGRWIRNFVWSGYINTTHHNVVAWDIVCLPEEEGGIGIKSMRRMNDDAIMKMTWKSMTENSDFGSFIKARFRGVAYKKSSVWHGFKEQWSIIKENLI